MLPIVLIGAGGHARACIDVIEEHTKFSIVGLIGAATEVGTSVLGYHVLGTDDDIPALRRVASHAIVATGQIKSPDLRIRLFSKLVDCGWDAPAIISPQAHVSRHATIGCGTIVMHGAIVNAGAIVGRNCILNSQSLVEHDSVIGDHCHVSTSATVNSGVRIGIGAFLGSGSRIRQSIQIGDRCVIGMGQLVLVDCAAGSQLPNRSVA